jgi:hypothetical protein
MPTMAFERTPECSVAVFGSSALSDEDWDRYVASIQANLGTSAPRALVIAGSTAPSTSQRARLEKVMGPVKAQAKVAIVTSSTFVRGVVNAFALITPGYRAFAPAQLDEAMAYLDVRATRFADLRALLDRLRAQIA